MYKIKIKFNLLLLQNMEFSQHTKTILGLKLPTDPRG